MDLTVPFRGTDAIAAGAVTPAMLLGRRFQRLFRGVYVAAGVDVDLAVRSFAAYLLVEGSGALCGFSAAEVLGAACGPVDAPAEVVVPGRGPHGRAGLRVRYDRVLADEVTRVRGVAVTTPLRTAFDLGRRKSLVEAVVAVDALARVHGFAPHAIVDLGFRHPYVRGRAALPTVARMADPRSGSPMETRIRLALLDDGLPYPALQHPVGPYALDLAYPELLLAIEYDGREHLTPERARHDLTRQANLTRAGWEVLRFDAATVLRHPHRIPAAVRRMIAPRSQLSRI